MWTVRRHGGRYCDTWRDVLVTPDEERARKMRNLPPIPEVTEVPPCPS